MAGESYTRMWEAFLGGEWEPDVSGYQDLGPITEGLDTSDYLNRTRAFYQDVIGPVFIGTAADPEKGFGTTDLGGWYAAFDPYQMETAEEIFRSEIGDPYGTDDPFSWEKLSRYDTRGGGGSRADRLLRSELYGQGKLLGGQVGAGYETGMATGLEEYTTGMTGEREDLTYGALTSGAALASGGSGAVLRSGESIGVAEDVLTEAYKKARGLGTEYQEGRGIVETEFESGLDEALGTYLASIDDEKSRWFNDVMSNVHTFRSLDMPGGVTEYTAGDIESKLKYTDITGYEQWACGYGQRWDRVRNKCVDTAAYTTERYGREDDPSTPEDESATGYEFRESGACGIGEIWKTNKDGTGQCVPRIDYDLVSDQWGSLCASDDPGLLECGECGSDCSASGDKDAPGDCVVEGCSQYGPDYQCNADTGYCYKERGGPDKKDKPHPEIVECEGGTYWDGSSCVPISPGDLIEGDECPGGMIFCGGSCSCLPGQMCSYGECVSSDLDDDGWGFTTTPGGGGTGGKGRGGRRGVPGFGRGGLVTEK